MHRADFEWVDLSDIESVKRYCEKKSFAAIYNRVRKRRNRGITFIGSGNYHYVSFLLLSEIKEPFTLILFDYHTDMLENPDANIISCGSWVLHALKYLPQLKKVIIIGVEEALAKAIPKLYQEKVIAFPHHRVDLDPELPRKLIAEINTNAVYISIDKDVLSESEVYTDWEQGTLTLEKLEEMLWYISTRKKIVGEDICGEYPRSAIEYYQQGMKQIVEKNERANLNILKIALKAEEVRH